MKSARAVCLALACLTFAGGAGAAPNTPCELKTPDVSVHGIKLGDGKTSRERLGQAYKLTLPEPNSDFPWAVFFSSDGKQTMALQKHPGGGTDDFMMAEVQFANRKPGFNLTTEESGYMGKAPRSQVLPEPEFVSGAGIRLGMSKTEVLGRLGRCFVTMHRKRTRETIRHQMDESVNPAETPGFLKRAKMPGYIAEYEFERDKLVRYRFGFPYP